MSIADRDFGRNRDGDGLVDVGDGKERVDVDMIRIRTFGELS